MFAWAEETGLAKSNPCKGVTVPKRTAPEKFLTADQAARLLEGVSTMAQDGLINLDHADALRLLLLTGARKTEILGLRWSELQLERRHIVLPAERSKAGSRNGERRIPLSAAAIDILQARSRSSPFVFPAASDPEKHTVGLQKTWSKVRSALGFEEFRVHDLRHSYASLALAKGASLFLVGRALGHASSRMTERYAHLADDPLIAVAEAVSCGR